MSVLTGKINYVLETKAKSPQSGLHVGRGKESVGKRMSGAHFGVFLTLKSLESYPGSATY